MAEPTIKQNRTSITEPSLSDLLDLMKKDIFLNINCHHVAQIQSFDKDTQTVQATIMYKKTYFQKVSDGTYQPILKDYPILIDVPVIVLKGGAAHLQMPIAQGDECLILFNDRDIDNWFQTGQVKPNASSRLHSFSDGFALIGVSSSPKAIADWDMTRASLNYGTTSVGVSATKIRIKNEATTLNTQLQALLTQLQSLTTAISAITVVTGGVTSTIPVNAVAITAIGTQIGNIATQIGGLLE